MFFVRGYVILLLIAAPQPNLAQLANTFLEEVELYGQSSK
jgi:hypothetical protein